MENCWEAKKCGREPGGMQADEFGVCPAATATAFNGFNQGVNAGRVCWFVAGTLGSVPASGVSACRCQDCTQCDFYQKVNLSETIIKHAADSICVFDETRVLLSMNPAAHELFGDEMIPGHTHWDKAVLRIFRDEHNLPLDPARSSILALGHAEMFSAPAQLWLHRPSLPARCLDAMLIPVSAESGTTNFTIVFFRDITESKRLEEERKKFITTVSHEMRTPMTSLVCFLRLLEGVKNLPPQETEFLRVASRNARRLSELINTVLQVEQLEMGAEMTRRSHVDLAQIIQNVVDFISLQAKTKGLTLKWNRELQRQYKVNGDPERLEQLVANLLVNAIKYTQQGEVEISLQRAVMAGEVEIKVRDTGIGIRAEDAGKIFEGFYRAPNEVTHSVPGTGLGLRIVKDIVKIHEGRIMLESQPGQGSIFSVRLPGQVI